MKHGSHPAVCNRLAADRLRTAREHYAEAAGERDEKCLFTDEEWEAIDAHEYDRDLPGIRFRGAIDAAHDAGLPVRDYDGNCDQLKNYAELAQIVENGGIDR